MSIVKKIRIKALILGTLADIGSSMLIGTLYMVTAMIVKISKGEPVTALDSVAKSTSFLVFSLIAGLAATAFGGYIAGKVAKQFKVLHGGIIGLIGIFIGLLFTSAMPMWFSVITIIGMVPFGIIGGYLAARLHSQEVH